MNATLQLNLARAAERAAYLDLVQIAEQLRPRALPLTAQSVGPALVVRSPLLPSVMFNRTFGMCASHGAGASALVDSVVARYRAQRIERFFVHLPRGEHALGLRERLRTLGLRPHRRSWQTLAIGEAPALRDAPRVERATRDQAETFGSLVARGYRLPDGAQPLLCALVGRPGWHAYLAFEGDVAVAALGMRVARGAAYLAFAASGLHQDAPPGLAALIAAALPAARRLGAGFMTAEVAAQLDGRGTPLHALRDMGFTTMAERENWWLPPPSARHGSGAGR